MSNIIPKKTDIIQKKPVIKKSISLKFENPKDKQSLVNSLHP